MGGRPQPLLRIPGSLEEARAVQEEVAREAGASRAYPFRRAGTIGGADASYSPDGRLVHAAVAVFGLPDLNVIERCWVTREVLFPYLPGYFAFREGPAIMAAVGALATAPDILLVDGHGRAHPRRAGIATHVGLLLGIPTVGVAKRMLSGDAAEIGPARGSARPVWDRGEIVGMAVRTRGGSRPVYVSPGYATDLETAVAAVLTTTAGSRIPAPVREAHRLSREIRRISLSSPVVTEIPGDPFAPGR
ncbi:MAG: endonuclease V [Methanomicrobiales archaeon]|nr:endonuclease V [Methanomicrobiales archaeon]